MVLLGCTPLGRTTEQHDIFFGIAESLTDLTPQMNVFWPEAKGKLHIDVWREVTIVNGFAIEVVSRDETAVSEFQLFFLNLGGYKMGEFEEYHYKILGVATSMSGAISNAKKTSFYKHCGFKGATSHIDEKYGIDVDDFHKVTDLLDIATKSKYQIKITPLQSDQPEDQLHIGYQKIRK